MTRRPVRVSRVVLCVMAIVAAGAVAGDVLGARAGQADAPAERRFETRRLNEHFWAEGATVGDINRDARADIVSGPVW